MNIALEMTGCMTDAPTGIAKYILNLYNGINELGQSHYIQPYIWLTRYKHKNKLSGIINKELVSWHYMYINSLNRKNKFDIAHTTDLKFLVLPKARKIATIHDLAIFKKETNILSYTSEDFKKMVFKKLKIISGKADALITVSNSTKQDFLEMFPNFDENRIRTIYLASTLKESYEQSDEDILNYYNLKKKNYFVFVGAVSVRKNLINILIAYKQTGLSDIYNFVIVGPPSMGCEQISKMIIENKLEHSVKMLKFMSENHLSALYKNSIGLVFPTYYEGFGMPILEAMQCRIPVICGNIGAAPEVASNHGIQVNPFSIEEIAEAIKTIVNNNNADKIESAYVYSKNFSWKRTALDTLKFYEEVCQ